jgi:hypothetical protein
MRNFGQTIWDKIEVPRENKEGQNVFFVYICNQGQMIDSYILTLDLASKVS